LQLLLESGAGPEGSSADAQQHTSLSTHLGKALVAAAGAGRLKTVEHLLNCHVHLASCAFGGGTDSGTDSRADISKADLTQALCLLETDQALKGVDPGQQWACNPGLMLKVVQQIEDMRDLLIRHGADKCAT
jgi:hypothetical protein